MDLVRVAFREIVERDLPTYTLPYSVTSIYVHEKTLVDNKMFESAFMFEDNLPIVERGLFVVRRAHLDEFDARGCTLYTLFCSFEELFQLL